MAVRNYKKAHPTAVVPKRKEFIGDPAFRPEPRKKIGGDYEPLPGSRYSAPGYDQRVAQAKKTNHGR